MSQTVDRNKLIASLTQFSKTPARNHIALVTQSDVKLRFVDIGLELSTKLKDVLTDRSLSLKTRESLNEILDAGNSISNEFGPYLALMNIGILFEPELKLNIRDILLSYSKNQCLIILEDPDLMPLLNHQALPYVVVK